MHDGVYSAKATNILQFIPNTAPRYSYIHFQNSSSMMNFHRINNHSLNQFDIQIRNEDGVIYTNNSLSDFHINLIFEINEGSNYNSDEILRKLALESFQKGHPTNVRIR